MLKYFQDQKVRIDNQLRNFLLAREKELASVNAWGTDVPNRLYEFTKNGKMIRGGLVILAHDLFGGKSDAQAVQAAAVMELFQSAFLIHDDIMDRDLTRRGRRSLFAEYRDLGTELGFSDAYHFGESLGISAGDVAFFLGFEILSEICLSPECLAKIVKFSSREIACVGIAQMQDVYLGNLDQAPDEESILRVYLYKTGRYTFSLPLMIGAHLAGAGDHAANGLGDLGEKLGLIFQIKDDELGLFGEETDIGKPVGTDLKENKKSLYHYHLFRMSQGEDRKRLSAIFGKQTVTREDLEFVRGKVREYGIPGLIAQKTDGLLAEARRHLASLESARTDPELLKILAGLLDYSVERKK